MPELPEVETVARQLADSIEGACLVRKRVLDVKLASVVKKVPNKLVVQTVFRHGKEVVFEFDNNKFLAWHLRMTGRLGFVPNGQNTSESIKRFCRVELQFDRGVLYFSDVRRFGTCEYLSELKSTGVDPVTSNFSAKTLQGLVGKSKQSLKLFLMRQDKIVGIGNIYASEILFDAKLSPERIVSELSDEEVRRLYQSIKKILKRAIKHCGTTFSDFQDSYGELGKYQNYLKVYGRKGEECSVCATQITKIVQGQRSTFFCPSCQI